MKQIESLLLGALIVGGAIPQTISGHTIVIENVSGEQIEMEVDANERFSDVSDRIQAYLEEDMVASENHQLQWNLGASQAGMVARAKTKQRAYLFKEDKKTAAFQEAKKNLAYIVKTLADDSIISIGKKRDKLQSKGDSLEWLHPLQFLEIIFTDDEMKAGLHKINTRKEHLSWLGINVKEGFYAGIIRGMQEESERNNLLPFIDDFAKTLGVNDKVKEKLIQEIKHKEWKKFVYVLLEALPREGNDRYDM
jgi:hypothetical protein